MRKLWVLILLCGCVEYSDVRNEYKKGNPYAKILLEAGLNQKSLQIDDYFLEKALEGDKEALTIVLAQLKCSYHKSNRVHPVIIPMNTGKR